MFEEQLVSFVLGSKMPQESYLPLDGPAHHKFNATPNPLVLVSLTVTGPNVMGEKHQLVIARTRDTLRGEGTFNIDTV